MDGERSDGFVEHAARALAVIVVRSRVAARQVAQKAQPAVTNLARRAGEELTERGPDLADTTANRAVDRTLSSLAARAGFLGGALHQLRPAATRTAGQIARALAEATKPSHHSQEAAPPPPTEGEPGGTGSHPGH